MTINHASPVRPTTVTVPWVEVDDASEVSLVAAPGGDFYPVDEVIFTTVRVDPVSGQLLWNRDADYADGSRLYLQGGVLYQDDSGSFTAASMSINGNVLTATLPDN